MKELYLHIGMPKTGTSTLQHFFKNNKELLEKNGIYYPEWSEYESLLDGGKESTFGNFGWIERVGFTDSQKVEVIKQLFEKHDKVLLSTECIWIETKDKEHFLNILKNIDSNISVKVIVYLRRQVDYLEAQYREYVRVLNFSDSIEEVFDWNNPSLTEVKVTLDYCMILSSMEKAIGLDNIIVRVYETAQFFNGNIVDDFMSILGITVDDSFELPQKNYNPSMSNSALELKRLINKSEIADIKELNDCFYEALMNMGVEYGENGRPAHFNSLLREDDRCTFMEKFKEGNSMIAKRYLGKKDGILFRENYSNVANIVSTEEVLEQTIQVFASVFVKMQRKQELLEARILKLEKKDVL